jgi:hypothetical protein
MATNHVSRADLVAALKAVEEHGGNISHAAAAMGLHRKTLANRLGSAARQGIKADEAPILQVSPGPDPNEPIEDLLARKKAGMQRSKAHEEWAKLINVTVNESKPLGLFLVGDPHVDDDHCDIERLEHDLTTVGATKGFYAGHIGDLTNNWVGRLARLNAHQSTTFSDGVRLTEWMLGLCNNLFVINGNHDLWNNGGDLLRFIVKAGVHQSHGARLALNFPGGKQVRIHARHDFPGKSQFSDTHGMKRELLFGHKDHILVAGHTHVDEARLEPSIDGTAHWLFRVSGYKVIDEYAKEHNFRPKRLAPGVSVIIDPNAKVPAETVKPFWCVESAADYLRYLRK